MYYLFVIYLRVYIIVIGTTKQDVCRNWHYEPPLFFYFILAVVYIIVPAA